jgi:hypothetical protein
VVVVTLLLPFPAPPAVVGEALTDLAIVRGGDEDEIAQLGDLAKLPRPWDPATCPDEIRQDLWEWLDSVAEWLNHEYGWRTASLIPPCWPQHPRLIRELAVLACLRASAADAITADPLEDWHRYALPGFIDRMNAALGEGGCRNGKHNDWPAAGRFDAYTSDAAATDRLDRFYADTHRPTQLRLAGTGRT